MNNFMIYYLFLSGLAFTCLLVSTMVENYDDFYKKYKHTLVDIMYLHLREGFTEELVNFIRRLINYRFNYELTILGKTFSLVFKLLIFIAFIEVNLGSLTLQALTLVFKILTVRRVK